jgi:peptidoglycan hydrolase-like protein with peptidoglycan-binding domain
MEQICADNNFGYDQSERLSGYNSIVKNGNKIHEAKGEFDCSSLVSACYKLSGLDISVSNTTRSIRASFIATGKFEAYFDDNHLYSDKFAKRGGLFLKEGSHVVMALENGSGKSINPYNEPTRAISKGCEGDDVKWVQWELCDAGFVVEVDGKCGLITDTRIKEYQRKNKLYVDGKVGPITRNYMKTS